MRNPDKQAATDLKALGAELATGDLDKPDSVIAAAHGVYGVYSMLQTDGRLTGAEVGRRVGLSQPAASARIQRLEKNGVITGYRAVVDPAALGLNIHAFSAGGRPRGRLAYSPWHRSAARGSRRHRDL